MQYLPRIMIAGTHSGTGKTTIATAVMALLKRAGLRVQPYKVGPDYIDPGFHHAATGRISRNLDTYFLGEDGVKEMFAKSASDADISVIEGVMGLYDGIGATDQGSSAHVAKLLQCPVILVMDVRSMARSAAAVAWGYANMPGGVPLAGIILNRVGSTRHLKILKQAIEEKTGIPVVGGIMREEKLTMPERHLGLVPSVENEKILSVIDLLAQRIGHGLSSEMIVKLARNAPALTVHPKIFACKSGKTVRLCVVRDSAFNFYYQDGLDLLEAMGAEVIYCSALYDAALPERIDGIYIGGGFPEMFIEQLADNQSFIHDLQVKAVGGMPIYAECGGFMYLCRTIKDFTGREYNGAGVIPGYCQMCNKRIALGYAAGKAVCDNILVNKGDELRGHEFHYSKVTGNDLVPGFYLRKSGIEHGVLDGHAFNNILATYLHVHFAGATNAAAGLIKSCHNYRRLISGRH